MEELVTHVPESELFGGAYAGARVLVTGHTGFKGSWMSLWLAQLDALVTGYSLEPPTSPSLFVEADVEERIGTSLIGDVNDLPALEDAFARAQPRIVFHMAAQSLVRPSYDNPVETFGTNVMGTVNVLEAARRTESVRAVVVVTSDKCYENDESGRSFCETDALGGHDPYSASKSCAEIVTAAYRSSFLAEKGVRVASVRAGNVIGGGDWSVDRLIPDAVSALIAGNVIMLRHPYAIRPWQHVLEPISGYLHLGALLLAEGGERFARAWNFGPREDGVTEVHEIAQAMIEHWGSGSWQRSGESEVHEAGTLRLDCSQVSALLGWSSQWNVKTAVDRTAQWYSDWHKESASAAAFCERDIAAYVSSARANDAVWVRTR